MSESNSRLRPSSESPLPDLLVRIVDQSARPTIVVGVDPGGCGLQVWRANAAARASFEWVGPRPGWEAGLPEPVESAVRATLGARQPLVRRGVPMASGVLFRIETVVLDDEAVLVTLQDTTRSTARRRMVSVLSELVERSDDLAVVCIGEGTDCLGMRAVVTSRAAVVRSPRDSGPPTLGRVLGYMLRRPDIERLDRLLARPGSVSWAIEAEGRQWECSAWSAPGMLAVVLRDAWSHAQMMLAMASQGRQLGAALADHRVAREALDRIAGYLVGQAQVRDTALAAARLGEGQVADEAAARLASRARDVNVLVDRVSELLSVPALAGTLETVELDGVLDEVCARERSAFWARDVTIERAPLPIVWARWRSMLSLFGHLIRNALAAGRPEAPLVIRVGAVRVDDRWRLTVSDNGVGVPREHAERVFGPWVRVPGREADGPGLGLTICRRIVRGYGGRIGIDDGPGEGCRVWFELPPS